MKEIKVVVVDDSPFSVGMLSNILTEKGFLVVGAANSLSEAVDEVTKQKPDVVTMDVTMPGADGFECTKAVHSVDPDIKVVIVSSMMDDEIIRKAKSVKASGYIQKPVDADELALEIHRIMANEELFFELERIYYTVFKEAFHNTWNKFFKSAPVYKEEKNVNGEKKSRGLSVVMGIIGQYGGRMIIDMSSETAKKIAEFLMKTENASNEQVVNVIAEISNVIAGNACSLINKTNDLFGLRVAPPTAVYGEAIKISKSELSTISTVVAETVFGEIYMDIGFNRSGNHE